MRYPLPTNTPRATFLNDNDRTAIDLDVEAVGRRGSGRITAKVLGYWSSDVIYLYIDRRTNYSIGVEAEQPYWRFELSHSSGGRDLGEEPDSLVAEVNFAEALTYLAVWGRTAREALSAELEAAYQRECAEARAEREEAKRQKEAAIAADTPLGENGAKALVSFLEGQSRQQLWVEVKKSVFYRGSEHPYFVSAKCYGDRVTFRTNGNVISRKALIAELSASSHRNAQG